MASKRNLRHGQCKQRIWNSEQINSYSEATANSVKAFRLFAKPFSDTDSENIPLNDENDDSADFNLSESELNAGIHPKLKKKILYINIFDLF